MPPTSDAGGGHADNVTLIDTSARLTIPHASAMRSATLSGSPRPLPVAAVGVTVAVNPARLDQLSGPVATIGWTVHPAITELFTTSGVPSGAGWLFTAARAADVLAWVHPGVVHPSSDVERVSDTKTFRSLSRRHVIERLRGELGPVADRFDSSWWDAARTAPAGVWMRTGRVLVERRGQKVWIRVVADDSTVLNPLAARHPQRLRTLTFNETVAALEAAAVAGFGTVDVSSQHRFGALWDAWWGHDLLVDTDGAPGWVRWRPAGGADHLVPLTSAIEVVSDRPAIVAPSVVDKVAMVAVTPVGRAGLRWYQDEFAEQYRASQRGSVCALPPGTGKTIAALAAVGVDDRTLVCAPVAVLDQWSDDATLLFGSGNVTVVRNQAGLAGGVERAPITVMSYDVAVGAADALRATSWENLVVDEAVVLCGTSKRARGLRMLRSIARRGLALTATPAVRSIGDAATLVAWARGEEPVVPRTDLDDVWGPVLYAHDVTEDVLPGLVTEAVRVAANGPDRRTHNGLAGDAAKLHDRAVELRRLLDGNPPDRGAVRRELASVRVQLVNLVRTARKATGAVGSAKFEWCLDHLATTAAGSPALVFSDRSDTGAAIAANLPSLRVATIDGTMSSPVRHQIAERFIDGDLDVVVVAAAGQRGMNLQGAHQVIHLDLPTTAAQIHQRNGRAARIGAAASTITVVVPVAEGTIDGLLVDVVSRDLSASTDVGELEIAAWLAERGTAVA